MVDKLSQRRWRLPKRSMAIALLALSVQTFLFSFSDSAKSQILSPPPKPIDAAQSVPIRKLMTNSWERGSASHVQAKTIFENAAIHDDDLLVAYLVNCIRHNRTQDAKLAAHELTDRFSDNIDGWMFKTWLNTLTNKYDAALINMRSFKKKIDVAKDVSDSNMEAIYKRLGRLIGYMQGPVTDRVNQDLLNETIRLIAAGAKPDLVKLFNENREKVLKQYDELLKSHGQKTQVELDKVKISNDAEAVGLERQVKLLEKTESQLLPEKQRVREEAGKQISSLEQQGSSLQQQLTRIGNDIRATELDLQYMYRDLNLILQQPPRFQVGLFNLQNQIRSAELALNSLAGSANQTSRQINSLSGQIGQVRNGMNQRINELDREIKRVNGSKRRSISKLTKIAKGPKVAQGKRDSMRSRAQALRTYDDLVLALYRQDILDQLTN